MKRVHGNTAAGSAGKKKAERNRVELLRGRIELLTGRDKLLMTMHLENGNSFRQISRVMGVNTASVARRIHKITERLINGEYVKCLRSRDRFTEAELEVAKDYFLHGMNIRKIAEKRRRTYYHIREMIRKIRQRI